MPAQPCSVLANKTQAYLFLLSMNSNTSEITQKHGATKWHVWNRPRSSATRGQIAHGASAGAHPTPTLRLWKKKDVLNGQLLFVNVQPLVTHHTKRHITSVLITVLAFPESFVLWFSMKDNIKATFLMSESSCWKIVTTGFSQSGFHVVIVTEVFCRNRKVMLYLGSISGYSSRDYIYWDRCHEFHEYTTHQQVQST